jgi:hypothetical protein
MYAGLISLPGRVPRQTLVDLEGSLTLFIYIIAD